MVTKTLTSKAFIFDLDGTVVDTTDLVVRFWTDLAAQNNLDPQAILETSHGRRTIETLERWMPHLATMENVAKMEAEMAQETDGVIILPGVKELLDGISVQDWTINTAGTNVLATTRLHQFNIPLPKEMATGDKLTFGKPHPEGYLLAAKMINRDPKDCIVFEDAPAGVRAAIAAGMQCIACTTTHTVEQLKEAGATAIVDFFTNVRIERQLDDLYTVVVNNVIE